MHIVKNNISAFAGEPPRPYQVVYLTESEFRRLQEIVTRFACDAGPVDNNPMVLLARNIRDYGQEPKTPGLDKLLQLEMRVAELRGAEGEDS